MTNDNQSTTSIQEGIQILSEEFEQRVKIQHVNKIDSVHLEKYNFMLISYQAWENLLKTYPKLLNNIPSSMIINNKTSPFQKKRMKLNEETDMQAE